MREGFVLFFFPCMRFCLYNSLSLSVSDSYKFYCLYSSTLGFSFARVHVLLLSVSDSCFCCSTREKRFLQFKRFSERVKVVPLNVTLRLNQLPNYFCYMSQIMQPRSLSLFTLHPSPVHLFCNCRWRWTSARTDRPPEAQRSRALPRWGITSDYELSDIGDRQRHDIHRNLYDYDVLRASRSPRTRY